MNSNNDSHGTNAAITKGNLFVWTFANACILGLGAWIVYSNMGGAPFAQHAEAAPPPVSALNLSRSTGDAGTALDAGSQRADMVNELRAMRQEISDLKAFITSGGMRTEVTNLGDIKLQIDYAQLRDAARGK